MRRVVQVRWMWVMWALWLALDVIMSFTGTPWPSTRTLADRVLDDIGLAIFVVGVSFGCAENVALTDTPAAGERE